MFKVKVDRVEKTFYRKQFYIDKICSLLLDHLQIAREAPQYFYAASGW